MPKKSCRSIIEFVAIENSITPHHLGWRKKVCTVDAILNVVEDVNYRLKINYVVACAFEDLSKTFDAIDHWIILENFMLTA